MTALVQKLGEITLCELADRFYKNPFPTFKDGTKMTDTEFNMLQNALTLVVVTLSQDELQSLNEYLSFTTTVDESTYALFHFWDDIKLQWVYRKNN